MNGSPVYPSGQVQDGTWLMTLHRAPAPQEPGQGSRHFSRMHAFVLIQSELTTHSGLHDGGVPIYSGRHEHDGTPLMSRHCEYGPQGEGTHGLTTIVSAGGVG